LKKTQKTQNPEKIDLIMASCLICCESETAISFLPSPVLTCAHGRDVCVACHASFLVETRRISASESAAAFACLDKDCAGVYTSEGVTAVLQAGRVDDATRDRVLSLLTERWLAAQAHSITCTRPNCGALIVYEPEPQLACQSIVCSRCANAMCVLCRRDAHDDVTCEEYEERASNGAWTSEKLVNALSRKCPKCHFRIFREGGCPHMTCSRCRYQFCYGCLGDRSSYRAGQHVGCEAIASAFEQAGLTLLKRLKDEEKARLRKAKEAARAQQREAALKERAERRARGDPIENDDDDDDDFSAFNPFRVFESVDDGAAAAPAPAPAPVPAPAAAPAPVPGLDSPPQPARARQRRIAASATASASSSTRPRPRPIAASANPDESALTSIQRRLLAMSS
jgi:hypothetical protein